MYLLHYCSSSLCQKLYYLSLSDLIYCNNKKMVCFLVIKWVFIKEILIINYVFISISIYSRSLILLYVGTIFYCKLLFLAILLRMFCCSDRRNKGMLFGNPGSYFHCFGKLRPVVRPEPSVGPPIGSLFRFVLP